MRLSASLPLLCLFALVCSDAGAAQPDGRILFEQKCASCHTIGGGDRVGPDLYGVAERRSRDWLVSFVTAPEQLINAGDPIAVQVYEQYNRILMPNLGLTEAEAVALVEFMAAAQPADPDTALPDKMPHPSLPAPQSTILSAFVAMTAVIVAVFAWVGLSTRRPAEIDVTKAYRLRKVFFVSALLVLGLLLAATLPRVPYATPDSKSDRVVYVAARQFDFVFSDEPLSSDEDIGRIATIKRLVLPAGTTVEFRVTSLDVNHGFGLYSPDRQLIAQTQAMPGYVNRLFVDLTDTGTYQVVCMEYCAAGHHLMRSSLIVE